MILQLAVRIFLKCSNNTGPFFHGLHSLSCFSDEMKDPVTLLFRKQVQGRQQYIHSSNAEYIRTFNLLQGIGEVQNSVSKIKNVLI